MEKYKRNPRTIIAFLAPAFIIYTVLLVLPIFANFYFSCIDWIGIAGAPMHFVWFNNYVFIFHSSEFWISIKNILWFLVLTLLTQLPIGLLLALFLSTQFRGFKFFKATYFVPVVISVTAVSLIWYFILFPNNGVLNGLLTSVGLKSLCRNWLVDKSTAMTTIILVNTWVGIGFHMTVNFAAITGIPEDVLEAAKLDGATGYRKLFYIVIPMIWESIRICIIIIITAALKTFDIVYVMTQGGPNGLTNVPSTLVYQEAFKYSHYGAGSAIAVCIFVLSISMTIISLRLMRREKLDY
jgi:raffinose/stachyose/melibiose transport system permease protein